MNDHSAHTTSPEEPDGEGGARRRRLIDAALEVFGRKGYRRATIRDLAAAAGVSPGLFYHYFRDKADLLRAVLETYSLLPEVRRILAVAADRPAHEVLLEVAEQMNQLLGHRAALVRIIVTEAPVDPEVHAAWVGLIRETIDLLAGYLRVRVQAGELRAHRPEVVVRALVAPVVFSHLAERPAEPWLADLVSTLLDGLRVAPKGEEAPR